jgi:hypothetical protein
MSKEREPTSGALEGARRATGGAPEERRDGRGRWSAKRKTAAILRLLHGEDLETLSRELGVTAATLPGWRDQFLDGGEANLRAREADVENEETQRLKSLVADLNLNNKLLGEKIHRLEAKRPLVWRRSKPSATPLLPSRDSSTVWCT